MPGCFVLPDENGVKDYSVCDPGTLYVSSELCDDDYIMKESLDTDNFFGSYTHTKEEVCSVDYEGGIQPSECDDDDYNPPKVTMVILRAEDVVYGHDDCIKGHTILPKLYDPSSTIGLCPYEIHTTYIMCKIDGYYQTI